MDVSTDVVQSTASAQSATTPSVVDRSQQQDFDNASLNDVQEGQDTDHRRAPFACNVCKRSYSRIDHLARHHRSRRSCLSYRNKARMMTRLKESSYTRGL